jgi:hypothetical protein
MIFFSWAPGDGLAEIEKRCRPEKNSHLSKPISATRKARITPRARPGVNVQFDRRNTAPIAAPILAVVQVFPALKRASGLHLYLLRKFDLSQSTILMQIAGIGKSARLLALNPILGWNSRRGRIGVEINCLSHKIALLNVRLRSR